MPEPGPGDGSSDGSSVWEDVTKRQPERDVPPPRDHLALPAPGPGPPPPQFAPPTAPHDAVLAPAPPPESEQPRFVGPGAPQPGQPVFVNPNGPPPGAPHFVRRGGAPIASQPQPGGPIFVSGGAGPGMQAIPGGPVFVQASPQPSPVDPSRPWRWWVGPVTFLVAIFGIVPAQLGLVVLFGALEGGSQSDIVERYAHWFGLVQDVVWIGIVLAVPYLIVKHLRPEHLGLRRPPLGRALGVFAGAFVAFYVFAAVYSSALGLDDTDNTMLQDTGFGDGVMKDVILALLFTVAAPVAEELLFRGLLFRTIRDGLSAAWGSRWGLAASAIISGFIFGGVHFGGGQDDFLPVLMLLGVVLALAYHWTGSLYVPIAIHSINNAIATGANSDPSSNWIFVLIGAGPVIALLTAYGIGRGVKRVFPSDPKDPARTSAQEPATL